MPKMRMGTPSSPVIHTKRYTSFRGVDFSSDPSQVSDDRSPYAVNVIADAAGCPKKRPGWAEMAYAGEVKIHGIHRFKTTVQRATDGVEEEVDEFIVHAGDSLRYWQGISQNLTDPIMTGLTGESSAGFMHDDKLYILTGAELICVTAHMEVNELGGDSLVYTASDMLRAKDAGYIPLTRYNCTTSLANTGAGGEPSVTGTEYEPASIATRLRRNTFKFSFGTNTLDDLFGKELYMSVDGEFAADTALSEIELKTAQGNVLKGGEEFISAEYPKMSEAVVWFAYYVSGAATVSGLKASAEYTGKPYIIVKAGLFKEWLDGLGDTSTSFTITYPAANPKQTAVNGDEEEIADYFDRIRKCRFFSWYNSRLFVSGNPDYPNADWYSEVGEPTYFKEINYTEIGNDDSPILGYLPVGDRQAIIKGESVQLQDASIYLRSAEWEEGTGYIFPVKKGITGTGAVGMGAFGTLIDDAMYLSRDGVMGIVTENITGERVLAQRSTRINAKLLKESNLKNAVCGVWNGYFIIAVNGHMYLADSRQRTYARNVAGNFEYEWYYWEDIPVSCICAADGVLHFGTRDGSICTLLSDWTSDKRLSDWPLGTSDEPRAITAAWATKFDDDGDFMVKKNMTRRGCGIFLKGVNRGNVKVLVRTDKTFEEEILSANRKRGVFTWEDIDFENFTFETMPRLTAAFNMKVPEDAVKVKKYSAIQVIVRSDEAGNDLGVLGIERRFIKGYYEK